MKNWQDVAFHMLIEESRDGEWGIGEQEMGHTLCEVIRGTDFSSINNENLDLPKRWVKDHLVDRKRLQVGDVLLETAGGTANQSTGRSTILRNSFFEHHSNHPILCASFSRHLRLKPEYNSEFVYYLLQALYLSGFIAVYNLQHTGVARFQFTTFKNKVILKIPDLKTQRKIAGILSAYDDLIENNKRRIALLEKMAEELYREWFVRFRFPGWREAEFEKGIPKGWDQVPLKEIANILMGQSPASEFYNTDGHGLPFHQGVGTYGDRFPNNENYCSVSGRIANEGDILFSVRAPVGRLNIASEKMIIGRGLSAIRHKENYQSYLFYLLKSAFASEDIIGNGSIFNSVGKDELIGFKIFKPKQNLIESFEKNVAVIDKQIAILMKSVRKLQETKNALLPRLMSGKLAVEDLAVQLPPSMREATA